MIPSRDSQNLSSRSGLGTSPLSLDLNDPIYGTLCLYAGRIALLLTAPSVNANPDLAGSLDDLLGAVYSLIQSECHKFTDRTDRSINVVPVRQRAAEIAKGRVCTRGKWIAGYYFNSALFRTAAVCHRVLQIVVGTDEKVGVLIAKAQVRYPHWTSTKLIVVHRQVNELKHKRSGVYSKRAAKYNEAITAVTELLALIEAHTAANAASPPMSGLAQTP
jgi:hypothetical protein